MGPKWSLISINKHKPLRRLACFLFLIQLSGNFYYLKREQLEIIIGLNNGLLTSLFNLEKSDFSNFQIKENNFFQTGFDMNIKKLIFSIIN